MKAKIRSARTATHAKIFINPDNILYLLELTVGVALNTSDSKLLTDNTVMDDE